MRTDLSRITCWCQQVFQVCNPAGTAWDEAATAAAYHAHVNAEGPPPTPAAAQDAQRAALGITATVLGTTVTVTVPTVPVVGSLLGGQQ